MVNNRPGEKRSLVLTIEDVGSFEAYQGIVLGDFLEELAGAFPFEPLIAVIDNQLVSLHHVINQDCQIKVLGADSNYGQKVLRKSAAFILTRACLEMFPGQKMVVRSTIANGLYMELVNDALDEPGLERIRQRMQELIDADLPIRLHLVDREQAREIFMRQDQPNTAEIVDLRNMDQVHLYELDGFYDYIYDFMVYKTGAIKEFKLILVEPGLILQVPEADENGVVALRPYVCQPLLFRSYRESKHWAELMNTPHVASLNRLIQAGDINELILINEALHEKKIGYIADRICQESRRRVVLIAGPTASGKTSFSQRLLIQLRANGRRPLVVSLDNYFVDRIHTPRDENGGYDFESINALKLETFNEHLQALMQGKTVEMPVYNFKTGSCEEEGQLISLPPGEPVILEGIHCLNDELTVSLDSQFKFRIYVSALSHINLDYQNHISTTDIRLMRRIVRDARCRGYEASGTIRLWPSVRRGEERYIFKFQENADVFFNSSLVYELPVLKRIVEPMLAAIGSNEAEFIEAARLVKLLSYILPVDGELVPRNSILSEFIGGSCLNV